AAAVACAAGALLAIDLLGGIRHFGPAQRRMGALLRLGALPAHHPVQDVRARLQPEDVVGQLDVPGLARGKRNHVEFHLLSSPSGAAASPSAAVEASASASAAS